MNWFADNRKKPKILLVEDNELQAELTASAIVESGLYEVLIAHNGEEALNELARNQRGFDFLTNAIACLTGRCRKWTAPSSCGHYVPMN